MKIKTLVADDERLARERLRDWLREEPEVEVVGECADGAAILSFLEEQKVDLLFLDIQMPELSGFDVLSNLSPERRPVVIFVTAYDKFALQAFEAHAIDYLLKPFDRERFQVALHKGISMARHQNSRDLADQMSVFLSQVKTNRPEWLPVKSGGKITLVKLDEIDWIEAADNYVQLCLGKETHLLRRTISSLDQELDPDRFVRASRSLIVNVSKIRELQPLFHGDYAIVLRNGTRLTLSRSHRDRFRRLGLL